MRFVSPLSPGARARLSVLAIQAARLKGWRRARLSLVAFSNELVALLEAGLSLVEAIDG